jgi:hypothetical protein
MNLSVLNVIPSFYVARSLCIANKLARRFVFSSIANWLGRTIIDYVDSWCSINGPIGYDLKFSFSTQYMYTILGILGSLTIGSFSITK